MKPREISPKNNCKPVRLLLDCKPDKTREPHKPDKTLVLAEKSFWESKTSHFFLTLSFVSLLLLNCSSYPYYLVLYKMHFPIYFGKLNTYVMGFPIVEVAG
uniref:Uncharacterized protein n=1 Tax=Cacopsylla melanoneura TaxID=428564 RepID=A0A8D8UAT2_9HEMI